MYPPFCVAENAEVKFKDFVMAMKNMIFTEDEARCVVEVLKEKSGAIHDVLQKVDVCGYGVEKAFKWVESGGDTVKWAHGCCVAISALWLWKTSFFPAGLCLLLHAEGSCQISAICQGWLDRLMAHNCS